MIDARRLLADLTKRLRPLEDDLAERCATHAETGAHLRAEYESARARISRR